VVNLRRTTHNPLSHAATDALSRASTEELLMQLRRRIFTPREAREVWEDWGGLNPALLSAFATFVARKTTDRKVTCAVDRVAVGRR